jgi:CRP-like cAMP-binding protein
MIPQYSGERTPAAVGHARVVARMRERGKSLAEIGPGAILGERALLEGGTRTATLRAVTSARVAVATADQVAPEALAEVAKGHRREDQ